MEQHKKVVLVTGGSRGIGAATSYLAAQHNYAVGVNYHQDASAAERVVSQIVGAGGQAVAIQADVRIESDVRRAFDTLQETLGPITALVNNAGILERQARVEDISVARLRRVLDVNVIGAFLCAREAVKQMSFQHGGTGGTIVNVSSRAAVLGSAGEYVDYAMSKGALDTLTIGLAGEVASEGIRVNTVRPGIIDTELHASGGEPGRAARLGPTLPLGRVGTAQEVAQAILWLMSEHASFVTGTFVDVSGGR